MPLRYFCIQGSVMEFFVESEEASRVQRLLCDSAVEATQGCRAGLVSVVGEGLTSDPDILAETLEALNHGKVNPIWVTVNGLSISVAVRQEEIAPLVRRLHQQFIEEETGATVLARSASPGHSQVSA
jgi:aspartokinase